MLSPITYVRKPFPVDALEVGEDNMYHIAEWCGGEVRTPDNGKPFIKVPVKRPMNDAQTRAGVGDWVLNSGDGFKVYNKKAFYNSFEKPSGAVLDRLIQERKPRPFPNEPSEMQEEVTPLSRQESYIVEGGVPTIVDLRDVEQKVDYTRPAPDYVQPQIPQ